MAILDFLEIQVLKVKLDHQDPLVHQDRQEVEGQLALLASLDLRVLQDLQVSQGLLEDQVQLARLDPLDSRGHLVQQDLAVLPA